MAQGSRPRKRPPYGFADDNLSDTDFRFWLARDLGCDYLLFDCDADAIDALPVFPW